MRDLKGAVASRFASLSRSASFPLIRLIRALARETLFRGDFQRFKSIQEHNQLLMQALTRMSQRVARLEKHNRWLAESTMDAATALPGWISETTANGKIVREVRTSQLQRIASNNHRSVATEQIFREVGEAETAVPEPLGESRAFRSDSRDTGSSSLPYLVDSFERQPRYLPRKKHVLMVASVLARGGVERQMLATVDGLLRRGYQVTTFCFVPPPPEANFLEEFSRLGVKCLHALEPADAVPIDNGLDVQYLQEFSRLLDHLDVLALGRALGRTIKKFQPDIVHCWSDFANTIGGLVSTNLGVPRVVLAQSSLPAFRSIEGPEPYACRDAYRLLAGRSNVRMSNNSLAGGIAYAKWLDLPNAKIKVLHNAFSSNDIHIRQRSETDACREHLGLTGDMQVVGAVTRFAPEKDPILWVETAAIVAAARPNARFLLAGYGELAEQVAHSIRTLGLSERFVLPGAIQDVGLIYAALDVFLMTSQFEGLPNVVIEAQAAGIPVVVPNVGGASEALLDDITGIVVGSRRPLRLASAVLQILDDPTWRERAQMQAPAFVSNRFGLERMIDETIAMYDANG